MLLQVDDSLCKRVQIFRRQICLRNAAVVFQGTYRRHKHYRIRLQARLPAFDIEKLFRSQVSAEACLSDHVICQLQCRLGGSYGVAAMRDIGEGTAVHQRGRMLQRLDQVGLDGILQKRRHGAHRADVLRGHRPSVKGVSHHHAGKTLLQIRHIFCQAENRHDLRGHGNNEMILPDRSVRLAAKADHDIPEHPVVHIQTALPHHLSGIDAQLVSLLNMIIKKCRTKVVGRGDGMKISRKMQVQILHGNHLGISAACGSALDAKARSK